MKTIIVAMLCLGALTLSSVTASAQSRRECEAYARDVANQTVRPGGQALAGGLLGAGVGAVIGGIAGNRPGVGAAIGAGVGAGVGAAAGGPRWQAVFDNAYDDCRRGSRANFRGGNGGRLEPWTRAWYQACSARYRSFNPDTGYYNAGRGNMRFCSL